MANPNGKTIDQLPSKDTLIDTDLIVVDDGTVSYKIPVGLFKTFMTGVASMTTDKGTITLTLSNGKTLSCTPSDPEKQNKLTFDSTPTANSNNPVTSAGIKSALDQKASTDDVNGKVSNDTFARSVSALYALIGSTYSQDASYAVGDYVLYDSQLYKCTGATTGAFDQSKWSEASVTDLIKAIDKKTVFDSTPTSGSMNPVTSGGVYTSEAALNTAIETETARAKAAEKANADNIAKETQRAKDAESTLSSNRIEAYIGKTDGMLHYKYLIREA